LDYLWKKGTFRSMGWSESKIEVLQDGTVVFNGKSFGGYYRNPYPFF